MSEIVNDFDHNDFRETAERVLGDIFGNGVVKVPPLDDDHVLIMNRFLSDCNHWSFDIYKMRHYYVCYVVYHIKPVDKREFTTQSERLIYLDLVMNTDANVLPVLSMEKHGNMWGIDTKYSDNIEKIKNIHFEKLMKNNTIGLLDL